MTDRSSWEPRRWSDAASDAPESLRSALQEARALSVDHARVLRLAERVGVQTGVAAGVGLSSVAPPASVAAFKLWLYLSGAVAVSGVALVVWTQLSSIRADAHIANVATEASPVAAGNDTATRVPNDLLLVETAAGLPIATIATEVTPTTPARERPTSVTRTASHRRAHPGAVVVPPNPTPTKLDPQAELAILNRAQDALAQAPRRALTLVGEHGRDFPQGVFAQEREVIAIEALLKLQRTNEATARGEAFLSAFPTSTHAPRVQHMLGQPR